MNRPDLQERVQTLEDELAGLESMIDARTRKLWAEIQNLQEQVKELTEAKTLLIAQKARGGDDERSAGR